MKIAHRARKTKGQAAVVFALVLLVLLAFVGLALDGGLAFAKRRAMQNAADAASIAGAREVAQMGNQPAIYNRINEYSVQRNGAAGFSATYYPGSQQIGSGSGSPPTGTIGVCVTAQAPYQTTLVGLVGINSVNISAQACAAAQNLCPSPGYAIWAEAGYESSSSCDKVINWTGGNYSITGNVHSNGNVYMSGGNNTVNGSTEYVAGGCYHCGTNGNNTAPTPASAGTWPIYYDVADYRPAVPPSPEDPDGEPAGPVAQQAIDAGDYYVINGDFSFDGSDPDGLYYVTGDARISDGGLTKRITIVAEGEISVSGSSESFTPYTDDGLLLFSNKQAPANQLCNGPIINVSGGNSSLNGVIFAPGGQIQISGSSNTSVSGSVIGWAVKLTGCCLNLSYSDEYCPLQNRVMTSHLQKP